MLAKLRVAQGHRLTKLFPRTRQLLEGSSQSRVEVAPTASFPEVSQSKTIYSSQQSTPGLTPLQADDFTSPTSLPSVASALPETITQDNQVRIPVPTAIAQTSTTTEEKDQPQQPTSLDQKHILRNKKVPSDSKKNVLIKKKGKAHSKKATESSVSPTQPKKKKRSLQAWFLLFLFALFSFGSVLLLSILFIPDLYYYFFPSDPVPIITSSNGTPLGGSFQVIHHSVVTPPPYDASLPEGDWLIIPRIGVRTEILESVKPEDSLNKGVWRVPDFGTPVDQTKPIILAAHRYGWKSWWDKSDYWKYHSFYLLPELQPGDLVEIIWQKHKYTYEIYAGEQGEEIKDYNADLILYTCKFLNSPVRHFRYARLVDFNTNTQAPQTTPPQSLASPSATILSPTQATPSAAPQLPSIQLQ